MSKITVIIVNGSGGVGKSTFCTDCAYAIESLTNKEQHMKELSSVSWAKEVAKYCGWDGVSKTEKDRKFLSDLNVALEDWNDSPLKTVLAQIEELSKNGTNYFAVNIREPWRIQRFKEMCVAKGYEFHTLLLTNYRIKHIVSNIGDASVFDYEYDTHVCNDGDKDALLVEAFNYIRHILVEQGYEI